jgi:hypothetical protein
MQDVEIQQVEQREEPRQEEKDQRRSATQEIRLLLLPRRRCRIELDAGGAASD